MKLSSKFFYTQLFVEKIKFSFSRDNASKLRRKSKFHNSNFITETYFCLFNILKAKFLYIFHDFNSLFIRDGRDNSEVSIFINFE